MSERQKGFAAVLLAGILWSTGGLFIKLVDLPSLSITAWRSAYASLVFLVLFRSKVLAINRQMWINSVFYAVMLLAFVSATKLTTAANAIFLQFTAPAYVLVLEPLLFKLKLKRADVMVVIAALGSMCLFFLGDFKPGGLWGNLLGLLSGISLAVFVLGQRLNKEETHFAAIFWGNLIVVAVSIPLCLGFDLPLWAGWADFWRLTILGIVQIGLAYAFFTYGLRRTLAIEASLLSFIEPILNPLWVWLGYGEIPDKWAIVGGVLIVCSLVIWTIIPKKRTINGESVG